MTTTMRRSASIRTAFDELKAHHLPRGALAYDELRTAAILASLWLTQFRHFEPTTSVTERRIDERELARLEDLRDELLHWATPEGASTSASSSVDAHRA
jgi:hypothetical protein